MSKKAKAKQFAMEYQSMFRRGMPVSVVSPYTSAVVYGEVEKVGKSRVKVRVSMPDEPRAILMAVKPKYLVAGGITNGPIEQTGDVTGSTREEDHETGVPLNSGEVDKSRPTANGVLRDEGTLDAQCYEAKCSEEDTTRSIHEIREDRFKKINRMRMADAKLQIESITDKVLLKRIANDARTVGTREYAKDRLAELANG